MPTVRDIEGLRRSLAMAPLSGGDVTRLLDACDQLLRERAHIVTVLSELPTSWATVRAALNDLQRLLVDDPAHHRR